MVNKINFFGLEIKVHYFRDNIITDLIDVSVDAVWNNALNTLVDKMDNLIVYDGSLNWKIENCKLVILERENKIITKLTFKKLETKFAREEKIKIILSETEWDNYSDLPNPNFYSE
jgi:hypothetical protein